MDVRRLGELRLGIEAIATIFIPDGAVIVGWQIMSLTNVDNLIMCFRLVNFNEKHDYDATEVD